VNDEERIRSYMRGRADVSAPADLRWPTTTPRHRRPWAPASAGAWGRLAAAGLVLVVVAVGAFAALRPTPGPVRPTAAPASGSGVSPTPLSVAGFPTQVAGLPVVTVAHALNLLTSDALDGRALAVAGFYQQVFPSCPAPSGYVGPLEHFCALNVFADTLVGAQLCTGDGGGMTCREPSGGYLSPFFMSETSGDVSRWLPDGPTGKPVALVLIGHRGDARQWQCSSSTQSQCADAFVVDRIAWAAGQAVPLTAPETGDQQTGKLLTPKLTLAQALAAAGVGDRAVVAAAFRSGDIETVDPRWNLAGDTLVWVVRSLSEDAAQGQESAPETVSLVDDTTGKLLDRHPLALAKDYRPARLWQMATVHGLDCCAGNDEAFYRVQSADGTVLYEGLVRGWASGEGNTTTFGANRSSGPLVLPAGQYAITAWLASYSASAGAMGTPRDECSTQITLQPLDDVALNAEYPPGKACTFGPAPSPSPGS
jgi:hypothetical protein